MIDKADIIDNDTKNITSYDNLIPQKNISFNKKSFNVFKSFKNKQKSCEISNKLEEDNKIVNNIMNIQKNIVVNIYFLKEFISIDLKEKEFLLLMPMNLSKKILIKSREILSKDEPLI